MICDIYLVRRESKLQVCRHAGPYQSLDKTAGCMHTAPLPQDWPDGETNSPPAQSHSNENLTQAHYFYFFFRSWSALLALAYATLCYYL